MTMIPHTHVSRFIASICLSLKLSSFSLSGIISTQSDKNIFDQLSITSQQAQVENGGVNLGPILWVTQAELDSGRTHENQWKEDPWQYASKIYWVVEFDVENTIEKRTQMSNPSLFPSHEQFETDPWSFPRRP